MSEAQLHRLGVSVTRLPPVGLDTGATLHAVLRIRDFLLRIRIRKSVFLTNGFGSKLRIRLLS